MSMQLKDFRVNIQWGVGDAQFTTSLTVKARHHTDAENRALDQEGIPYELANHMVTWEVGKTAPLPERKGR